MFLRILAPKSVALQATMRAVMLRGGKLRPEERSKEGKGKRKETKGTERDTRKRKKNMEKVNTKWNEKILYTLRIYRKLAF